MADFDYDQENDEEELEEQEDETNEEEIEEEIRQAQEMEKQAQKRRDANRLKKIMKTAPYRFYPFLTSGEKKVVQRLKKEKEHTVEIARFYQLMLQRKQAFWAKVKSAVAPIMPYMGYIALGVFIIIVVIVIIAWIFPFLFPEDGNGGKGMSSPFGIKGDKFYGARAVYKDETLSRNGLIEQYVDIVQTSVDNLQAKIITETIGAGEDAEEYEVKLTINLTLPAEDFNYEELNLENFATDFTILYNIVEDIAKLSYKVDNGVEVASSDLIETLDGVKYFGFNTEMIGSGVIDEDKEADNNIIEIVYDALTESDVVTIQERLSGSSDEFVDATNVTVDKVDDDIRSELISTINVDENKVRAEKLFIKDFIFEDADSYIEGVEKKNYVALIYLPKEDVDFDYVSYMINIDKTADFNMILTNNGSEISLSNGDGENWSDDDNAAELTYTFSSGKNLNQTASITNIINTSELNKFTSGSSLVNVVTTADDYNVYLEETTTDSGEKVLTYKLGNMYLIFETAVEFMFNDEMTY